MKPHIVTEDVYKRQASRTAPGPVSNSSREMLPSPSASKYLSLIHIYIRHITQSPAFQALLSIKKQRRTRRRCFFVANQPWEMAPTGQVSEQAPQSMQASSLMTYWESP